MVPSKCPGDGARHWHGGVHTPNNGIVRVCRECLEIVKDEWNTLRMLDNASVRERG